VPTPAGTVEVTVPAGSQSGRKLRLKGRGIPSSPPGDLYLILDVVLPPATSDRARALYEQMARELAFNPRERIGV
jgi:curved DNA-binding protein